MCVGKERKEEGFKSLGKKKAENSSNPGAYMMTQKLNLKVIYSQSEVINPSRKRQGHNKSTLIRSPHKIALNWVREGN